MEDAVKIPTNYGQCKACLEGNITRYCCLCGPWVLQEPDRNLGMGYTVCFYHLGFGHIYKNHD
jgi:hypothetical protein